MHTDALRWVAAIGVVLVVAAAMAMPTSAYAADVYVAPGGDDAASGAADKPVGTLNAAALRVRELRAKGPDRESPIVVEVRGGRYELRGPITLTAEDSGTVQSPTVYRAAPGESPSFSGGRVIGGWRIGDDDVWRTKLEDVAAGRWRFRELFVDGERRQRARWPAAGRSGGWLRVEKVGADRRTSFTYAPGDVTLDASGDDTELVFLHDWSISRIRVASIDPATRSITTASPVGCRAAHYAMDHFEKQPRYAMENHPAFLDEPGEWYCDHKTGELAYKPTPGQTPDGVTVIAPAATALLMAHGEAGRPIEHVRIEGLAFEHCAWALPAGGYAAGQATFHENRDAPGGDGEGNELREFTPAAVTVEFARNVVLAGCRVERVGGGGIWLGAQTFDCAIERCHVADVSGNGVMIGEGKMRLVEQTATGNALRDSVIERCGRQFYGAVGVWVGITRRTVIEHNEIAHQPYTGVSIGWKWDPTPTAAAENRIERNHIHHVMQVLSDGGGIYSLGLQPGSVIAGNVIHDVPLNAGRAESNGMFLDEGTTDIVIEGNAIWGIDRSPLRFHKAGRNTVRGNTLVVGAGVAPVRYNATAEANIELIENRVIEASAFDEASVGGAGPRRTE